MQHIRMSWFNRLQSIIRRIVHRVFATIAAAEPFAPFFIAIPQDALSMELDTNKVSRLPLPGTLKL